ncbi:MAG: SusC/RagA family TonB-linked outer membrane protein [Paludibacter sp.]|nr:SusC/RagA family TonB-linked outer membrane protein [Paludibacter sp.]
MRKLTFFIACLFLIGVGLVQAQSRSVSGKVLSADDGQPVIGASIIVKGTTIGTITGVNGDFTIVLPANVNALIISYVGMKTVELEAKNGMSVILVADTRIIDELVVTALGITRDKKALGYSVQDVKGDDINKAKETNLVNSLQGRISGAQITNSSGAIGASARIVLRGVNSLDGNNQPLFVVDGIPLANSNFGSTDTDGVNRGSGVQDINPDNIESISVLKGPNAAALYGSRASNGVIVVTTKSGKGQKGIGIEVSHSTTFENPLRLPNYQNKYGQGSGGKFEYYDGAGHGVNDGVDESWGPKLDVGLMIPQFTSPVLNGVRQGTPWISHPNNVKDFFNTGLTSTTSIALQGSKDKTNFRVSLTNLDQKGMIENTMLKKNTFTFNGSSQLTDKLSFSSSGSYVSTDSPNMPGYGYDPDNVMQQFNWFGRQVDINALKVYKNADGSWYNWNTNYHNNPYATLYENLNTTKRDRLFGNATLNYKFTDWLSAFVRSGVDYYSNFNTSRRAKKMQDYPNGFYMEEVDLYKEMNTDFLLSANKKFDDIELGLNIGGNTMKYNRTYNYVSAPELAVEGVYNVKNSLVPQVADNFIWKKQINSLYFSGQVSYKSMLFLDFSGRNDWSSALPAGNNSFFYPSVQLSGVMTEMMTFDPSVLSFGKLRVSYAKVGADTDPYKLLPTVSFGEGWNAGTKLLNQAVPNELPNANLKPQFVSSFEVGGDFRFLENRVKLDVTYYNSSATNQIISVPVSASSGYTTKVTNAGQIDNSGIEILLGASVLKSKNGLNWDVTVNWSKNRNEVVKLAEGIDQYELGSYWSMKVMAVPGEKYGSLFGYDFERNPDGQIIFRDGLPAQGDLKVLGNYTPDWIGGINNEFSYKGFNLGFLIDARIGGDMYSMTSTWGRYAGVLEETLIGREGGIVGDGVKEVLNANGDVVSYVKNDVVANAENFNKAAYVSDVAFSSVFDASYVKLREVKLGYTFNKIGKTAIRDVNVSLVGRNLALLYAKVPHIDPESAFSNSNVQGLEFGQIPSARSIGFSVSFKL